MHKFLINYLKELIFYDLVSGFVFFVGFVVLNNISILLFL